MGEIDKAKAIAKAKALAVIRAGSSQPPQKPPEKVGHLGGTVANVLQGVFISDGDEAMAGFSTVMGIQPDGNGGASWFNYDKPRGERYDTALTAIRSEMGDYQRENPVKSVVANIAGGVLGAATAAKKLGPIIAKGAGSVGLGGLVAPAATTAGKVAQVAAGGAVGGAIEGFNSGEGGAANRAGNSVVGAGVGVIFAPFVGMAISKIANAAEKFGGKAVRAVFQSQRLYDRQTGELTDKGAARLKELGVDAQGLSKQMQASFGIAAEDAIGNTAVDPVSLARTATADRFGVPLTKGQASGDVAQTASEMGFRAGLRGPGASGAINGFDAVQKAAVDEARGNLVPGDGSHVIDASSSIIDGVRREAEAARVAGREAYKALQDIGAAIPGDAVGPLRKSIELGVKSEGIALDAGTPNARGALAVIDNAFSGAEKGSVPFENIERARQRILVFERAAKSGSNGPDQVAVGKVRQEFDAWLDDTMGSALESGNASVLADAKGARGLWAKYRQTFLGREGADNYVRRIVEEDLSPDQVASWMFGSTQKIGGGVTSKIAGRLKGILGEKSPEWQEVRRAAWDRITSHTEGKDAMGPEAMANNISELLDGKGKTLGLELFTPQERAVMGEFRNMLKVLVPPKLATNPSRSGYETQRGMALVQQGIGAFLGGATGGPAGAMAGRELVKTGSNFLGTRQARESVNGVKFGVKARSVPVAVGSGVAAGASAQESTIRR